MTEAEVIERVSAILAAAGFEPMPEGPLEGVYIKRGAIGYVFGGVHVGIGEVHAWEPGLSKRTTNDPVEAAEKLAAYVRAKTPAADLTTEATLEHVVVGPIPDPALDMIPPRGVSFAEVLQPEQSAVHEAAADLQPPAAANDAGVERADEGDGGEPAAAAEWFGEDEAEAAPEAEGDPLDADFTEHADADLLALGSDVYGGFDVLPEPEPQDFDPDDLPPQPGPIAYAASDLDALVREKLGRVSQIARELKAILQEGWTLEEYRYLQGLTVRIERGEATDDQEARARFIAISERSQAMSRVDAHRDALETALAEIGKARDYAAAVAFDPEEGWPGQLQ